LNQLTFDENFYEIFLLDST